MSRNNSLHQLIASLTSTEKRYFKLNAGVSKTNGNLLLLFDVMEQQASSATGYDEAALRKHFKNHTFIKQFSVTQNRLTALILKHLRNYHASSAIEVSLYDLLAEIEVLYKKKLFDHCHKMIRKARKIAKKHERRLILLRLLKWEISLQKEEGKYLKQSQEHLRALYENEQLVLTEYRQAMEYKFHNFNLLLLSRNKMVASVNEELGHYNDLLQTEVFQKPFGKLPLEDEVFVLGTKAMYYFARFDYPESKRNFEGIVKRLEQEPDRIFDFQEVYFMALNNYLVAQTWANDTENYLETVEKIYRHYGNVPAFEHQLFTITNLYEVAIAVELGNLDHCRELLPKIEAGLQKWEGEINPINEQLIYFNTAIIHFLDENYSQSIRWLNRLINQSPSKRAQTSSNIDYYGQLFNLVVHYEAGNIELLEYLVGATAKFMSGIRPLNTFDQAVIDFFKSTLLKIYDPTALQPKFDELRVHLEELACSAENRAALDYFNFVAWAESKVENRLVVELIRESVRG
jgi:hypothetical protein